MTGVRDAIAGRLAPRLTLYVQYFPVHTGFPANES